MIIREIWNPTLKATKKYPEQHVQTSQKVFLGQQPTLESSWISLTKYLISNCHTSQVELDHKLEWTQNQTSLNPKIHASPSTLYFTGFSKLVIFKEYSSKFVFFLKELNIFIIYIG